MFEKLRGEAGKNKMKIYQRGKIKEWDGKIKIKGAKLKEQKTTC